MRIALFDQEPRISGATNSLMHLRVGLKRLGHDVDLVSFTKSGKPRKHWGAKAATAPMGCGWSIYDVDRVAKHADASDVLDEYDLIILTEPKNPRMDKDAGDDGTPLYVEWLAKTRTPWTTQIFGPQYSSKINPHLPSLMRTSSFVGRGVTYGDWVDSIASDDTGTLREFEWEVSPMPYSVGDHTEPTHATPSGDQSEGVVGITGRMAPNKGHQLLAFLPTIARHRRIELWGACSVGLGACLSYDIWEKLKSVGGESIFRDGPRDENGDLVLDPATGLPKHTPLNPFKWHVKYDGCHVMYRGNYASTEPFTVLDVHVNLTSPDFSAGMTEYATLEAIAAGKRLVINDNVRDDRLVAASLPSIRAAGTRKISRGGATEDLQKIQEAVVYARTFTDSDLQQNFNYLRTNHDPATIAQRFVDVLK